MMYVGVILVCGLVLPGNPRVVEGCISGSGPAPYLEEAKCLTDVNTAQVNIIEFWKSKGQEEVYISDKMCLPMQKRT